MRQARLAAVIFCVSVPALAVQQPALKFLRPTDLPSLGLRLNLMPAATPTPLAPAKTYTYTFRSGDKTWKEEMHSPHELWVRSQHSGRWVDEDGNALVMASIRCPLPGPFEREHVTRETYDKAVAAARETCPTWDASTITKWIVDFTGATGAKSQNVTGRYFKLKNLVRFTLDGKSPNNLAYAFRVNRSPTASGDRSDEWMLALFEVNPDIPAGNARTTIEDSFFGKLTTSSVSASRNSSRSNSFQAARPAPAGDRSPQFLESKRVAVDSIRNMKDWWHAETDNYVLLSNLGPRHRVMAKDLQHNIEFLRSAYEALLPPRVDIDAVSIVRIFATSGEYVSYVGESQKWSGGLWMPQRKELIVRPVDWGGSKDQRDRVFSVTYHEAFHQYVFYALNQLPTSVWFNEGHAELFESAEVRNRQLTVEEDEKSYEILEGMIKRNAVPIEELLHMSYSEFYNPQDNAEEKRRENYALAWAIVYYLRKGAPLEKPARNADIPKRYTEALWTTKDPEKATAAAFEGTTLPDFRRDFLSFWTSRNRRSLAKRNRLFTGQALRMRSQ